MRTSKAVSLDRTARDSRPTSFTRAATRVVQPSRFRQPATTSPASGAGDPLHAPPGGGLDTLARSRIMPDFASTRIRQSARPQAERPAAAARPMKAVSLDRAPAREREADRMGTDAARGGRVVASGVPVRRTAAPGAVQRMVLELGDPGDKGLDEDATNIAKTPGESKPVTDIGEVAKIKDGEKLRIVAHLEGDKIHGMSPEALAAQVGPHLQGKSEIEVILHACFAANPRALNKTAEEPSHLWRSYAGQFERELTVHAGWKVPVVASLGAEYTSSSGRTRVRRGHLTQADLDYYISSATKGEKDPMKQKQMAANLTNAIIEQGSKHEPQFFLDEDQGRVRFLHGKEPAPLKGTFEIDDYNQPSEYEIEA